MLPSPPVTCCDSLVFFTNPGYVPLIPLKYPKVLNFTTPISHTQPVHLYVAVGSPHLWIRDAHSLSWDQHTLCKSICNKLVLFVSELMFHGSAMKVEASLIDKLREFVYVEE